MDASAITPAYELLRDAIVEANKREVRNRLREAGFDPDFAAALFPLRASSSVKSSAAPAVASDLQGGRPGSQELDFQPRRSSRVRQPPTDSYLADKSHIKDRSRSYAVSFLALDPCVGENVSVARLNGIEMHLEKTESRNRRILGFAVIGHSRHCHRQQLGGRLRCQKFNYSLIAEYAT